MKNPSKKQVGILAYLKDFDQGLTQTQIAAHFKTSLQNTHDAVRRLVLRGYVEIENVGIYKLVLLTEAGKSFLSDQCVGGVVEEAKAFSPSTPKPTQLAHPAAQPTPRATQVALKASYLSAPHQRAHRIQPRAQLFRTSYGRIEPILDALQITYRKTSVVPAQYIVEWKGIKLKLTTRKLIGYGREITAPMEVEGRVIKAQALKEVGQAMESFLEVTNLRCKRDVDGNLILKMHFPEIAFTDNELARKVTEKGGFIPIAFNRTSGNATIWFDASFTHEMEVNEEMPHAELRKWGQAIQDGVLRPYEDEMRTRQGMASLFRIQQANAEQLAGYAHQIKLHLKLMNKIDRRLSQRRLE